MNPNMAQFKRYFSMPKKVVLDDSLSKLGKGLMSTNVGNAMTGGKVRARVSELKKSEAKKAK